MAKPLLVFLIVLLSFNVHAQNRWIDLPNAGFDKGTWLDTGRRVEDIYFTDTLHGFAVTLSNRLLKTIDGGQHWTVKNDVLSWNNISFRSIEMLDDGKHGIAGSLGQNATVLRTADSGETWTDITNTVPDNSKKNKHNICGLSHWGDTFYGVGYWGGDTGRFYKSTDKGLTWTSSELDTSVIRNVVDVMFMSADTGFIIGGRGKFSVVAKTTDGGATWVEVFSDSTIGGRVWKIQAVNRDVMVGAIEPRFYPDSVCMVYSTDAGNSWKMIAAGSIKATSPTLSTQGVGFISPAKGWIGGYYNGIFETSDSGKTWKYINFGYDFNRIFVVDSNNVFAGGHMPYKYGKDISTGIQKPTGKSTVSHMLHPVSPNPNKGRVKIDVDVKSGTNIMIEVVNVDTRTSYRIINNYLQPGSYTYYWDGSNAPNGNYLVWFDNNEIPQTQKFVLYR